MARITYVKKSQCDYTCSHCGDPIPKGSPYRWAKPATSIRGAYRSGSKRTRCMKPACTFRPSQMTSSPHLSTIYAAQESVSDFMAGLAEWTSETFTEIASELTSAAESIREAGDGYTESAESLEQYFPGSQQVEDIQEKAAMCAEAADQIENKASEIDGMEGQWTDDVGADAGLMDEALSGVDEAMRAIEL